MLKRQLFLWIALVVLIAGCSKKSDLPNSSTPASSKVEPIKIEARALEQNEISKKNASVDQSQNIPQYEWPKPYQGKSTKGPGDEENPQSLPLM